MMQTVPEIVVEDIPIEEYTNCGGSSLHDSGSDSGSSDNEQSASQIDLLNELDGTVDVLDWDADQARLILVQTVGILPTGFTGQPWAADLHLTPDGRHLYASERTSSTLAHFLVDAATGRLALQGHVSVETQPRGFAIDPTGRHLLVVGQLSHHLSRWAIDPESGQLDCQQRISVGQGPNWVEILA